ncbi:RUS family member 1 isoform X2 [Lycorma delicatula]
MKVFFQEVFLPQGYPESVSKDYFDYQLWDSIQAFCSTLSGTLTTQAIMKGVGVGDTNTTPLSAAITWILKDGTGMIGRILFAWKKGSSLDADCKKWRLFADFLNDSAMCVEMFLLPVVPIFSTQLLCLSTTMKAIVGVAGGATKAAVTQHQAIRNNMADVSAKDGSQETCLNLIGSIFGILMLSVIADSDMLAKLIFIICILLHLYSNYRAVKALNFKTLNKERFLILLRNYLKYQTVENTDKVNDLESVFLGTGITDQDLCGFQIELGSSLQEIIDKNLLTNAELQFYSDYSESCNNSFMVVVNLSLKTIFVVLKPSHTERDVLLSFYLAILNGIATSVSNNVQLKIMSDIIKKGTPLDQIVEQLEGNATGNTKNIVKKINFNYDLCKDFMKNYGVPMEEIMVLNDHVKNEFECFLKVLEINGWTVDRHHMPTKEWRGTWASDLNSKSVYY